MRNSDMDVAESPIELIGHTPMVRLGQIGADLRCDFSRSSRPPTPAEAPRIDRRSRWC